MLAETNASQIVRLTGTLEAIEAEIAQQSRAILSVQTILKEVG